MEPCVLAQRRSNHQPLRKRATSQRTHSQQRRLMLRSLVHSSRQAFRHASYMHKQMVCPSEPLVVVLGSTGTGKSDLAVELACRFNGEVINADAMQMYRGLPVTTNKISVDEQRGVPHHLLGTIGLDEETWTVGRFKQESRRIIGEIRGRGRLPIVVGGSQYYTDGLLFENHLVDEVSNIGKLASLAGATAAADGYGRTGSDSEPGHSHATAVSDESIAQYADLLDGPTEAMLSKLREVDPLMASRWHPNDRRKIRRSLEIFLTTGQRASDIYAAQKRHRNTAMSDVDETDGNDDGDDGYDDSAAAAVSPPPRRQAPPWNCLLLLWVYAQPDVLTERLDARVDTMLERGLWQETGEMHAFLQQQSAKGVSVDRSVGIWQSIGFKEVEPFLVAMQNKASRVRAECEDGGMPGDGDKALADGSDRDDYDGDHGSLAKLKRESLDSIRFGTRRYAKYQLRWIKHKTIPLLRDEKALDRLFLLDSTDRACWHANVAEKAVLLTQTFLQGRSLPNPQDVSETAREVLSATIASSQSGGAPPFRQTCEVCHVTIVAEDQWLKHIRGRRHRRTAQKRQRRALVIGGAAAEATQTGDGGPAPGPAAGAMDAALAQEDAPGQGTKPQDCVVHNE